MPTYDYSCSSCEHIFSKLLKISERSIPESNACPSCGKDNSVTLQIFSAPSLSDPIRMGLRKHDSGFKEVMEKMHRGVPGSELKHKDSSIF